MLPSGAVCWGLNQLPLCSVQHPNHYTMGNSRKNILSFYQNYMMPTNTFRLWVIYKSFSSPPLVLQWIIKSEININHFVVSLDNRAILVYYSCGFWANRCHFGRPKVVCGCWHQSQGNIYFRSGAEKLQANPQRHLFHQLTSIQGSGLGLFLHNFPSKYRPQWSPH